MGKIRIGIVGYGNIGRGVEQSIKRNDDMELKAVFTRRDPDKCQDPDRRSRSKAL